MARKKRKIISPPSKIKQFPTPKAYFEVLVWYQEITPYKDEETNETKGWLTNLNNCAFKISSHSRESAKRKADDFVSRLKTQGLTIEVREGVIAWTPKDLILRIATIDLETLQESLKISDAISEDSQTNTEDKAMSQKSESNIFPINAENKSVENEAVNEEHISVANESVPLGAA